MLLGDRPTVLARRSHTVVEPLCGTLFDAAVILHRHVAGATVAHQGDDFLEPAALRARVTCERQEAFEERVALMPTGSTTKLGDQRHDPSIPLKARPLAPSAVPPGRMG